jgi:rSAM/selenodomain-associated transferase 1
LRRDGGWASPPRDACALFAKPPEAGRVKTRLVGPITGHQAAELYRAFLGDLIAELRCSSFALHLAWALEWGEGVPEEPALAAAPLVQAGGSLGGRLHGALSCLAGMGHERVAAIGSDHPELRAARVEEAFAALDRHDVAIGPALDGGYYLIAARAASLHARLFEDVDWSTDRVLAQTLDRCRELGLSWSLLPPAADVDTPADLEALARRLRGDAGRCPRTEAVLQAWGWG